MGKLSALANKGTTIIKENLPVILTGVSVAGTVASVIFACKATPKAIALIEKAEQEKGSPLTIPEKIGAAWKPYAPVVGMTALSIGCAIGSTVSSAKHAAGLAALYTASESAFKSLKEQVNEQVGEKKARELIDDSNSKRASEIISKSSESDIIYTGYGEELCVDLYSGRLFRSSIDAIKAAENRVNKILLGQMTISLNEVYAEMGLPAIGAGYDVGFTVDNDLIFRFGSEGPYPNGHVALTVDFVNRPVYGYNKLY